MRIVVAHCSVDYAGRLGLANLPAVPSLALGSGEVTLQDMTSAYGAFAAEGVWHRPSLIRRVEDLDGQVLYRAEDVSAQAVKPDTAFLMTSMLQEVIDGGTAWKARQMGFRLPAAGKTGTTNDYRSAWFVGFTPDLVVGVFVGFDDNRSLGAGEAGAVTAVPIFVSFMQEALRNTPARPFRKPKQANAANVAMLRDNAAALRRKAKAL